MKPKTRAQFERMCHRSVMPKLTVISVSSITQTDISAFVPSAEAREFPVRLAKEAQAVADAYQHPVRLHDHTSEVHVFLPGKSA